MSLSPISLLDERGASFCSTHRAGHRALRRVEDVLQGCIAGCIAGQGHIGHQTFPVGTVNHPCHAEGAHIWVDHSIIDVWGARLWGEHISPHLRISPVGQSVIIRHFPNTSLQANNFRPKFTSICLNLLIWMLSTHMLSGHCYSQRGCSRYLNLYMYLYFICICICIC